jgi:Na+/proline symporter
VGTPAGRGERSRTIWLGILGLFCAVCIIVLLGIVEAESCKDLFAVLPHLTKAAVRGAVAGMIGAGIPMLILGPRRVQICLYGQAFQWRCSVCGRMRSAKR